MIAARILEAYLPTARGLLIKSPAHPLAGAWAMLRAPFVVVGLMSVGLTAGGMVQAGYGGSFATFGLTALAMLAGRPALDTLTRTAPDGAREPVVSGVVLTLMGSLVALIAEAVASGTQICSPSTSAGGLEEWLLGCVVVGIPIAALAWCVARFVVRRRLVGPGRLCVATAGLFMGVSLLVLASLTRARDEFNCGQYLDSLPALGDLSSIASPERLDAIPRGEHQSFSGLLGDISVGLECRSHRLCMVSLWRESDSARPHLDASTPRVNLRETVQLLRDTRHGLLLLDSPGQHRTFAFRTTDFQPTEVSLRDLHDIAGPPRGWIIDAGMGLALALAILLAGRRGTAGMTSPVAWRAGTLDGHGRIVFADGATATVPPPRAGLLFAGPVVVLSGRTSGGGAYRDDPSVDWTEVVNATPEALAAAVRASESARYAYALAALTLTAAPLAVTWASGLMD